MKNLTIVTINEPGITDFSTVRNSALAKVKTTWTLFLDSDETMTSELEKEIQAAIQSPEFDAYYLPRKDIFLGREINHGETGNAKFIRLAKTDYGRWERSVHEIWVGKGRVGTLRNPIIHSGHKDVASFLDKINTYSELEAKYRFDHGIKSNLFKIALFPLAKFKYNYFLKLGFLDGVPGTIMAIMMSFHSYLTWTKLYLLWHKK